MSFGIRHTFRTQHISRKIARTNQQDSKDEDSVTNLTDIGDNSDNSDNIFESNQNFVSNVLNRGGVQKPISSRSVSISSSSSLSSSSSSSSSDSDVSTATKPKGSKNSNLVSARLNLLKTHNKGVTKSEDHL